MQYCSLLAEALFLLFADGRNKQTNKQTAGNSRKRASASREAILFIPVKFEPAFTLSL